MDEELTESYRSLGLPAGPFESVGFFAPTRRHGDVLMPDVGSRHEGVRAYAWTLREFARDRLLAQVWATLLDEGTYLCSIRTMYRILEEHGEVRERRNQRRHPNYTKPELLAEAPNQVWSWDITKLRGPVKWTYCCFLH